MNLQVVQSLLTNPNIQVIGFPNPHSKASELYVEVQFEDTAESFIWQGLVPYYYRRTALFIETEQELADYLGQIAPYFKKEVIEIWIRQEIQHWETNLSGRQVTKPFFDELAKLEWTSNFPANNNPQRRIQDIKEMGYTISTRWVSKKTERLLVPIPRDFSLGYEVLNSTFRKRVLSVLSYLNVYDLSSGNKAGLLPDHKFPEIRWDEATRTDNHDTMTDEEIRSKFQLLDNQRNQQKREVCRNCFQTNKRGVLFGIYFFYEGDENWGTNFQAKNISSAPKVGKDAELGCKGCGWYDIQKWREELNKSLITQKT